MWFSCNLKYALLTFNIHERKPHTGDFVSLRSQSYNTSSASVLVLLVKTFCIQTLFHYFDVKLLTNPQGPVTLLMSKGMNDIKISVYK